MEEKKYTVAVCDDDKVFSERLLNAIQKCIKSQEMNLEYAVFSSGEQLLEYQGSLDILFLDIEMEEINGIQVKEILNSQNADTKIVFVTDYQEKMREAFGEHVYGFIDKGNYTAELGKYIEKMLHDIKREAAYIVAEKVGEMKKVYLQDILYMSSDGHYVDIYTNAGNYLIRETIKKLESRLPPDEFYRIHKSYLIHLRYLKNVLEKEVILTDGTKLPISKGSCRKTKAAYGEYIRRRGR